MLYRSLLKMWFLPPLLNIILILIGGWLLWRALKTGSLGSRRAGATLIAASCLLLYLLSTHWFSQMLLHSVESYPAITPEQHSELKRQVEAQPTAIVMLGSYHDELWPEYGTANLDHHAMRRIQYAVWLAGQLDLPVLATGGAARQEHTPHAKVVADYTATHLDFKIEWVEDKARTTYENAVLSKEILNKEYIEQVVLVTSAWHMRRSVKLFEAHGFKVIAAPTNLALPLAISEFQSWIPNTGAYANSYRALHEHLGWIWYGIKSV